MTLTNKDGFNRNPPAGFDGQFEWDYLIPAFFRATGRRIQPMDIDAHVEIGGHHLIFETKNGDVPFAEGQRKALLSLWAHGTHMVIFLRGKKEPFQCEIYWPKGMRTKLAREHCTKDRLAEICEQWARWANDKPSKFQYADPKG